MAKGKRGAALFEVINAAKGKQGDAKRSAMSTPSWMAKTPPPPSAPPSPSSVPASAPSTPSTPPVDQASDATSAGAADSVSFPPAAAQSGVAAGGTSMAGSADGAAMVRPGEGASGSEVEAAAGEMSSQEASADGGGPGQGTFEPAMEGFAEVAGQDGGGGGGDLPPTSGPVHLAGAATPASLARPAGSEVGRGVGGAGGANAATRVASRQLGAAGGAAGGAASGRPASGPLRAPPGPLTRALSNTPLLSSAPGSSEAGGEADDDAAGDGPAGPVVMDADEGTISVKVSFMTAAIVVAALGVLLVIAVMVGRRLGERSAVLVDSTEIVRQGEATPDVLRARGGQSGSNGPLDDGGVGGGGGGAGGGLTPGDRMLSGGTAPTAIPPSGLAGRGETIPNTVRPGQTGGAGSGSPSRVLPPAGSGANGGKVSRVVGLNYLIVQSYDASEEADARAVVALLGSKGVAATIEQRLPGFGNRLVVVSADGYPPRATEFEALRKRVEQVSSEAARTERKWRAFEPIGYRWR